MNDKLGAIPDSAGVLYRVWAPETEIVEAEIESGETRRSLRLSKDAAGYHFGRDETGKAGDQYAYRLDGSGPFPDPASRQQRKSVHESSTVVDSKFPWIHTNWQRPAFRDLCIYEIHIGTFTPEGTFRAAIGSLAHLQELGVNAIEIMPLADFPGNRGWGYDGVLIYAPARCYGQPEHLRALIDAAHSLGIAVILDAVYNHFGPDGNYLGKFSPHYFSEKHHTPWGSALNFDGKDSKPVRDFFLNNIRYWMKEFHFDGFRLDATHEIHDDSKPHLLSEIAQEVQAQGGYVIAEDFRNKAQLLMPTKENGIGLNAVWADDFHHAVRVSQTGESVSYYDDFTGTLSEVVDALRHGWIYRGKFSDFLQQNRGTPGDHLPPERFVHCISNHDQTGNRAKGERLNHLISPSGYKALSALLCLSPYTPMLFMGQEWAASSPFLFFTDHNEELGKLVTAGRRQEFSGFPDFSDSAGLTSIPDPQSSTTFEQSRLRWDERSDSEHAKTLLLYRTCLNLRRRKNNLRPKSRHGWQVHEINGLGAIRFVGVSENHLLIFNLSGRHPINLTNESFTKPPDGLSWRPIFSSGEPRFGGKRELVQAPAYEFVAPEVILFEAT